MISLKESLKILKETNALIEGHFILSSGMHSSQYVQCAQLLSKPYKAVEICQSLSQKILNEFKDIDIILSPAMGGIIVGYEIGKLLKKETIFAERLNKKFILRRNFKIPKNANVLIIEDVITTGKSSLECAELVINSGAKILGYACIIDRTNGKSEIKNKIVSQVQLYIPIFDEKNIPDKLKSIKAIKPGSRDL
jgi:orotate phosphoribosyltransferase|tara:strand:+ start:933 stop:1514 length:582 start_codon:yes stop_codon:yes gene_type:complete